MQVDPTLMNVGDGGTVSREASAPDKVSPSMVGNPPQTLPPELRGDAALSQQSKNPPAKDCNKAKKNFLESNSYNHNPEVPPPIPLNNAPTSGPLLPSSEKRGEQRSDTAKVKADSVGLFATSKWVGGSRIRQEDPLNASHSNVAASKKSQAQTQSVISLPPGFQCSTIFKPGQPVAFVPSTNLSSPLGQIAALREATASQIAALREATASQIAALREATASQIHKEIPPQSPGSGGTSLQRTYPYPFSVGRTPNPEKKAGASISKLKSSLSLNKSSKSVGEHKSLASVVASTAIALPLQHPSLGSAPPTRFTLSPTAAICCAPSLATITTQSRLLNHVEKSNKEDKTSTGSLNPKPTCASEDDAEGCPAEQRDVPLDLSAKSKRPKCLKDPLNIVCVSEHHHNETNQRDAPTIKRSNTTIYSSAVQYPVLPNTHRNGSHQKQTNRLPSRPVVEAKSSWGKGPSQDSIKNIPGTYVGVASPILASTLRGKDGKGTFVDEFQNFAKQEFISIVDQGEHLASKGKKPLYLMKGNQHSHSVKHVNSTSTVPTKNCTSKGATITALAGSAAAPQGLGTGKTTVPFPSAVGKPAWQQPAILTNQGASVQKKVSQGSPKAKGSVNSEVSMFQNAQRSPSKTEDDKWDRGKSPLSNLESIVKQKALETTALTGEGYAQTSPVAVRKADVLNPPPGGQDPQPKHTLEYPPSWTAEKNDWKKSGLPSQRASTQIMNRLGRAKVTEGGEISTEIQTCQSNREQQVCWKAAAFRGNASINGSRMESKLARVLEGELTKEQSGTSDDAPSEKFQGVVHSILTGQCLKGPDKVENKTNGTKEKSPTKAKSAVNKQKIAITKKPGKEKSLPDPSKKAMATVKKRQDKESTPLKVTCLKKQKRQCAPVLEGSASADTPCSQNKEEAPNDRSCFQRGERAILNTLDGGGSLPRLDTTVSPSCSISSKTPKSPESSTPRLRRGRRRCDEAHLEDPWGFAAPSPPPPAASFWSPPSPPPPPPSPPPPAPTQPARRPRGRPRSNPVPGDAGPAKAKLLPTTEGDAPAHKKRRRCRNRKYQGGEYIVEKDKLEDGERDKGPDSPTQDTANAEDSQTSLSPSLRSTSPVTAIQVPLFTRSGSGRYHESEVSPEGPDKPSGKRKFKSKHLSNNEEQKFKAKRSSSGKRSAPLAIDNESNGAKKPASPPSTPKGLPSPPPSKKGSRGWGNGPESPAKKPVPPEVRRLIVNKNAGETLLQRAARLGYQDVVLYCLEKDIREVNRRDNAGYTALHEASSRGWTRIVQILLKHGADVNCSAQDGTRPIHDAVASDNLPIVWLLLNHGADPTLATYSGHTAVKLAHSPNMKTFLTEYFTDLEGRSEQDPSLLWDFYSSSVFESEQESCWEFLLSEQNGEQEEKGRGPNERDSEKDGLLFEFSSEPLLPCYHVQVSLTQGFCNWFLLTDVLRRLKMSARIFRARYPHLEVVSLAGGELWRQVAVSQVSGALATPHRDKRKEVEDEGEDEEGQVELVRCVPELQRLLGSSIHILQEEEEEEEEERDREAEHTYLGRPCGR